ncbi:MAG: hypothetical protein ABIC91_05625 [Nanoarchaeota archaeon]|nr:hypothetical protein [Nanoarchaeota archaeon]MBU1031036.1 hypothetical protein [Nanoarchaeota archaeon]MBU1849636.1 hypothetical protein [Nanoarchaeota archaeon]
MTNIIIEPRSGFSKKIARKAVMRDFTMQDIFNIPRIKQQLTEENIESLFLEVDYAQMSEHPDVHDDICKYSIYGISNTGNLVYIDEFPFWNNDNKFASPVKHRDILTARYLFVEKEYLEPIIDNIANTEFIIPARNEIMQEKMIRLFCPDGEMDKFIDEWKNDITPKIYKMTKNAADVKETHAEIKDCFNEILAKIGEYIKLKENVFNHNEGFYVMECHQKAGIALANLDSLVNKLF